MELAEILKKVIAGGGLNEEEKTVLANYAPEKSGDRIPKNRLDAEIAKRREAESQQQELSRSLQELQQKVDELENRNLSEAERAGKGYEKELERLRQQAASLAGERDRALNDLSSWKFRSSAAELAAKHHFADAGYLEYLLRRDHVGPESAADADAYLAALRQNEPRMFLAEARSGAGSGRNGESAGEHFVKTGSGGDIETMIANAPVLRN